MNTRKIPTLSLFALGFLFLLLFGILAYGVNSDSPWIKSFDMFWINHIQAFVSSGLTNFLKIATELGNIRLIIGLTIIIAVVLFVKKRFADGLWFGGTILFCGVILTKILKKMFDRDRPDFLQLVEKTSESFPSGHATGTTIFYGFIGMLVLLGSVKIGKMILAGLITFLWIFFIMASRIYLGVHFPTDVLAGFFFGIASVFISIATYVHVREPLKEFLEKFHLKDQSRMLQRGHRRG